MVSWLIKLFISDRDNISSQKVRQSYGILSGAVGICLNILLFAGKFFAGILSNSIAITADAFNNLSDAGSSVITLLGFKIAGQKPDPDHPFGHGRVEYISGLLVSVAILFMAVELLKSSVTKLFHPEPITWNPVIVMILGASILVKFYMFYYNKKIGKKINSTAMQATATDSLSDTLATTVVLLSTLISHFAGIQVDGLGGVIVGLFIFYAGFSAAKDTVSPLLGQAPDPAFVSEIETIIVSHPDIIGIHDLIVHNYGPGRVMISVHAEVPADGDILVLHDLIDNIEHDLKDALRCNAVIHMDPVCTNDDETMQLKETMQGIIKQIDENLSLHDFRLVKGPTHTNIIFDLMVPYKFRIPDAEIITLINEKINAFEGKYFAVIDIDKKYT